MKTTGALVHVLPHPSPLPWPMSSAATESMSSHVTVLCLWSHTYPSICIFPSVANWTFDKCYSEDGFRMR